MKSMHMVMINLIPSMRTGVILKEAMNQNSQKRILLRDHKNKTNSMPLSDKCGVLIYWLLLFLFSWQSGFSVTDSAMEMLLKFLSRFFWLVGTFNEDSFNSALAKHLPNTLYKLKKHLGLLNGDDFIKYVICPKCKTLYGYNDCVKNHFGRQVSARCTFVPWFRHPHRSRRGESTPKVT